MTNLNELLRELDELKMAYSNGYLTINEYCETYLVISKKIAKLYK
jgi:hypothetical protein